MQILAVLTLLCLVVYCCSVVTDKPEAVAIRGPLEEVTAIPVDPILLQILPRPITDACVDNKCCDNRVASVDLSSGIVTPRWPEGVSIVNKPRGEGKCSRYGLLKVNFEAINTSCPCNSAPFYGRRMLKLVFYFHPTERSGFLFNIGDSISNNGYGGDSNHQLYDAEADGQFPHIKLYSNDVCKRNGIPNLFETMENALALGVDKITVYVANGYLRVAYGNTVRTICSECLYALNKQPDGNAPNTDIFIGLNQVVRDQADRRGKGLCRMEASWVCPEF